jgi:nitroreductase
MPAGRVALWHHSGKECDLRASRNRWRRGNGFVTVTELGQSIIDAPTQQLLACIRDRRSIGKMLPDLPPREAVEAILEAASWAPCHHLTEPWRFVVIAGTEREALGDVMARAKIERMRGQGREIEGELERAKAKALRSPVIVAVAVEPAAGPKIVEIEEIEAGAAAVQNMLLVAQSLGLATHWKTGDPAYDSAVKAHLGFSPESHIVGFVYLGYPAVSPVRARHTPAEALTTWRGWT